MASGISYKPLDSAKQEIRLLFFHNAYDFTDQLKCYLLIVSLQDVHLPPFYAISYTWGNAAIRQTMTINEKEVSVPMNSALALRDIALAHSPSNMTSASGTYQRRFAAHAMKPVWIVCMDAICIN